MTAIELTTHNQLDVIPELHLDGHRLRSAFESMVDCAEDIGGIESVIKGLDAKSILYQRIFTSSANCLSESEFLDACTFMPTVRRRLKLLLEQHEFEHIKKTLTELLDDINVNNADSKLEQFESKLMPNAKSRWIRDLAAEILHYRNPDEFPLMTRWVWDQRANTGVLREIWYSETETNYLEIPHTIRTHIELRRELHDFLKGNGVYANFNLMIDVLFAWIYSQYIGAQGGSFLKTDFGKAERSFYYAIRMLGLDAALTADSKSHLLLPNGKRHTLSCVIDATIQ